MRTKIASNTFKLILAACALFVLIVRVEAEPIKELDALENEFGDRWSLSEEDGC